MRLLAALAAASLWILALPVSAGAQGPPPPHSFGPDSTLTGVFTGQGQTPLGLSCDAPAPPTPLTCSGFLASSLDGTELDLTVRVPQTAGPHPLLVYMHGWGGSKGDAASYDSRVTSAGYTFLRYSHRGFGKSWGVVNLADENVELADLRSLIGQVVDDSRLAADAGRVGVFGVSYGGGQSWLAALHPTFASPRGQTVSIRAIAPIVPWTDLLYSLLPNGRPETSFAVAGSAKLSYVEALYAGGIRTDPERPYPNYPPYLTAWNADLTAREPSLDDPLFQQAVSALAGYRSIWWQQAFWQRVRANAAAGAPQLPVFEIQGMPDDLFPLPEALRMYGALKAVDPGYPIKEYFGDIGHPRADNKPGEMEFVLGEVTGWFNWYLQGQGPAPPLDVQAAITRPAAQAFNPADVIEVATWAQLATGSLKRHFGGGQVLTFNPGNYSGLQWDPVVQAGEGSFSQPPPPPPPDEVPGDVAAYTFPVAALTTVAGQPTVSVQLTTAAYREELNVRLFDVAPDGSRSLITRGTYTLDTGSPAKPIGSIRVQITAYGNVWQVAAGHSIRLELSNVDSPYIAGSRIPSVTTLGPVELAIPTR